jgi:3-dehydroquinate synthase
VPQRSGGMEIIMINVNLNEHSYPIIIENDILLNSRQYIGNVIKGKRIAVISDDNVFPLYGQSFMDSLGDYQCFSIVLPSGEQSKNFDTLTTIYRQLLTHQFSRSDLLVALGGGVIGDIAGFVAATYLRGVPYVQIPTSLLAQVDSSVGGKVAVDLPEGKNLIGAFYHPKLVIIDPTVLHTLPTRFVNDGMAEVIKYGCIKDRELFDTIRKAGSFKNLESQIAGIIHRCVDIKREIVEQDPRDLGLRMTLNFGHTLGHALEQFYHYQRESHGEAVAIGMANITTVSENKGLTKEGTAKEIRKVLESYSLPITANTEFTRLKQALMRDKKFLNNKLNLILLKEIGQSYIYPSDVSFFDELEIV